MTAARDGTPDVASAEDSLGTPAGDLAPDDLAPDALAAWSATFAAHVDALPRDAAHDPGHVRPVVAAATRLAADEGAPLAEVVPAAWLHDCVVVPKDSPDRARASRLAAAEARRLLAAWGYPARWHDGIAHAIEAHSFSAGIAPRTAAARVVRDADRLDALGAIGLARTLMLGGALGRALLAPEDPFCVHRPPDDARWTVDHFHAKLLHLADGMTTAAGRVEAERRTAFLRTFLAELARETRVDP